MKLFELIDKFTWKDIEHRLFSLYPDQKVNRHEYQSAYQTIQALPVQDDKIVLYIKHIEKHYDDPQTQDDFYEDVFGIDPNEKNPEQQNGYALGFMKWEKWKGMTISNETLKQYSEKDIVCHCLFEMTFYGFEQEQIQKKIDELDEALKFISDDLEKQKQGE